MFELSVATKYLVPKWRQLSSSIISLISCLVIALVVWLILVFFSVTNGLEKMWIDKLITLASPVRITPTQKYLQSYYYQIDGYSQNSDYNTKSLSEKLNALETNPYDQTQDQELPATLAAPLLDKEGNLVDLVKELFAAIEENRGITSFHATPYEATQAVLKITSTRPKALDSSPIVTGQNEVQDLEFSQMVSLVSLDEENELLFKTLIPLDNEDLTNLNRLSQTSKTKDLKNALLDNTKIKSYKTAYFGWTIPPSLYPESGKLKGIDLGLKAGKRIILLADDEATTVNLLEKAKVLNIVADPIEIEFAGGKIEGLNALITLVPDHPITTDSDGILSFSVQGVPFSGMSSSYQLQVNDAEPLFGELTPPWLHRVDESHYSLPYIQGMGDGILLPKGFRDHGARIGDQGVITYEAPKMTVSQQHQVPVYVAGFYDQGIMTLGGKFALVPKEVASFIRSETGADQVKESNGVHIRFKNYLLAPEMKAAIENSLEKRGISSYFLVESYQDFDFIKPFIQELKSQKNLFTILAGIIIIVACSNIVSMLIILVNDKKKEIGILRSMGASSLSIASIFGFAGLMMGLIGSVIGVIAALFTLQHLSTVIGLLSHLQGFNAFNSLFYGNNLPNELSYEALRFVIIATSITSLISGLVPAIKACMIKPSATLRSE